MTEEASEEISNTISGGSFSGPVLLGRELHDITFVITQIPTAPVALAQLPRLPAGFTGREAELELVANLLDPAGDAQAVVVGVTGLAGVGKTTLAIHAAHAAQAAGWFGGVLFIDLHGYDQAQVQPRQALDALLQALGVSGEHVPEDIERRAGLYRSLLARRDEPVLVVLDNARNEEQVRPLLPGPGPHRVIATSRHTLSGLGARLLDVTVLDQAAAVGLLKKVLREARPGDERVSIDAEATTRLAEVCGGLPLALQVTAALLIDDPALSARELADRLSDGVTRLQALSYDDGSGSGAPSVAAAFELSYRQLDTEAALLFRLLPLDPGPDLSTAAAGALAGWPPHRVRTVLGRLAKAHLVEADSTGPEHWRMHDLVRLYAKQLSDESGAVDDHNGAIRRLDRYRSETPVPATRLVRVTVNLTPRAAHALDLAAELSKDSKTDTINRAIQVYAYLEQINVRGGAIYIQESENSKMKEVKFYYRD